MKLRYWLVCALIYTTLGFGQGTNTPGTQVVKKFLYGGNTGIASTSPKLKALFAPSFVSSNVVDSETIETQFLNADHFMISEVDENMVTGIVWMDGSTTGYVLEFKTVIENGQAYILPVEVNKHNQVVPWHSFDVKKDMDPNLLIANTEILTLTSTTITPKKELIVKELSDYIQFSGEMVGADPSEDHFMFIISDAKTVTFVMSLGTISFNIYETKRTEGAVNKIFFRLEKNGLTPDALDWNEFVITDVSNLSKEEKRNYTAGIISDCKYVLDIKGDPAMRLLGNLDTGSLE